MITVWGGYSDGRNRRRETAELNGKYAVAKASINSKLYLEVTQVQKLSKFIFRGIAQNISRFLNFLFALYLATELS